MKNISNPGFSLIELMVALVVGAIMAHALLSAQNYSLDLSKRGQQEWNSLNYFQELLASRGLNELSVPSGAWIVSPDNPQVRWKTSRKSYGTEKVSWIIMDTDVNGTVIKWSWPVNR